ncbi:hypothetical protein [Jannaschia aquimarina]|uniref:hypothetical protein n=1 Tax=Jannaschia aquimarina TaxID=935700 RepID=UPI00112FEB97|nr:hypothetical protein [Jannaschia aquimarina]
MMAILEHNAIIASENTAGWKETVRNIESKSGLPNGCAQNCQFRQTRILSLLYCIFVFPKELWLDKAIQRRVYNEVFSDWDPGSEYGKPQYVVTLLRNSIAHGKIRLEETNVIFFDKNKEPMKIPVDQVMKLISSVGAAIALDSVPRSANH